MLTSHEQFGPNIIRLSLAVAGEQVTGTAGGRRLEGTVQGAAIEFRMDNVTAERQRGRHAAWLCREVRHRGFGGDTGKHRSQAPEAALAQLSMTAEPPPR
jgi:hypothetical protein